MTGMEWVKDKSRFDELWSDSDVHPLFLLKHSTACPISADAYADFLEVEAVAKENGYTTLAVKVIEDRPVSRHIADVTGIVHQSPQLLMIKGKEVIWHASHFDIHTEKMLKKLHG